MNENILVFILFLIFIIVLKKYLSNQKLKGIVKIMSFKHIEGMDLASGIDVNISFSEGTIQIDDIILRTSSVERLAISSSKQLVEQEKSVMGRAIIGSAFGGIGAIVGGMSGINDGSKETRLIHYLTMTFKDGSSAIFSFKNDSDRFNLDGVINRVREYQQKGH